jgi:phosphoribosylanthranilate isomerase
MCGMTRFEDVAVATEVGADAIGFVFYEPSPRSVTIEQAAKLVRHAGIMVDTVGLFVNADAGFVREAIAESRITTLQFHGDESPEFCQQFDMPYIKALRVKDRTSIEGLVDAHYEAPAIMLDAYVKGVPGGTGQSFDWALIPDSIKEKLILAGGLGIDNVFDSIVGIRPIVVDVSGGIEETKRAKSAEKMRAFAREVARADLAFNEISS